MNHDIAEIDQYPLAHVLALDADPEVATPEQWAAQTLDAYRPLFNDLATSLGQSDDGADASATNMALVHNRSTVIKCRSPIRFDLVPDL